MRVNFSNENANFLRQNGDEDGEGRMASSGSESENAG
jgi:hypothetical protein